MNEDEISLFEKQAQKLPQDVLDLIESTNQDLGAIRSELRERFEQSATARGIKLEWRSQPLNQCRGGMHKMVTRAVALEDLDAWLADISSPLKLQEDLRMAPSWSDPEKKLIVFRVCECTGPPHPLEYLAREAE